jgi:hypothetical protein
MLPSSNPDTPESFHGVERAFDTNGVAYYRYTEDVSIHVHVTEMDGSQRVSGFYGDKSTSIVAEDDSKVPSVMSLVWDWLVDMSNHQLRQANRLLKGGQRAHQEAAKRYRALHPDERPEFWKRLDKDDSPGVE